MLIYRIEFREIKTSAIDDGLWISPEDLTDHRPKAIVDLLTWWSEYGPELSRDLYAITASLDYPPSDIVITEHSMEVRLLQRAYLPSPSNHQRTRNLRRRGFIYLAEDHNGFCKIGHARDLLRRVELDISPKLPFPLHILGSKEVSDCIEAEISLHKMFPEKRLNGEWFRLDPKEVAEALLFLESIP